MNSGDDGRSPDLDPRRAFSRPEVRRAWELQDQLCKLCLRAIPFDLMHGDHIVPWARGGRTEFGNLQALCGSCNWRKGSNPQEIAEQYFDVVELAASPAPLRRWQAEALTVVESHIADEPILIEACPGAGKTRFGLEVALRRLRCGAVSRVLIVVPTLGIADEWTRSATADPNSPSIPLHSSRDWRAMNPIADRWAGAIFTYHTLFNLTEMMLAHATDPGHRTLVIFDEVHHAGANAGWGAAAQEAFAGSAREILSLSGTPFRTNRDPIVFVPSEGGSARPHYRYSYDQAIADGACRPVQFVEARGNTTFRAEDGRTYSVSFDDTNLTEVGRRKRLRSALEWVEERSIADLMIQDANRYLLELRRSGDGDAAGLIVCVDCDHADAVATHLARHVVGTRPVVACSRLHDENDPEPANALRVFRHSHDPWLVAVNMVSEGIDIRRLRVVVHLTNRLTLLSFRQIVGRVVRTDPNNVDDHGRVYIPADPQLVQMAQQVTDQVDLLPPPRIIVVDRVQPDRVRIEGEAESTSSAFEVLGSEGKAGSVFDTSGRMADAELVTCARLFIEEQGLTDTDAVSLALLAQDRPELKARLLELRDRG